MDWSVLSNFSVILLICIVRKVWSADKEKLENEVRYKQVGDKLYSKQTGYCGARLIIGSKGEETLENVLNQFEYVCMKEKENYVKTVWQFNEINILKRSSKSFEVMAGETSEKKETSEYFIYINREVWQCHDNMEKLQSKPFYRIVSELISIKEIYDIKYYDGVQVTSVNYLGSGKRVKIREIRYLYSHGENSYITVKYKGILTLKHEDETRDETINLINHLILPKGLVYNEVIKEVSFRGAGESIPSSVIDSASDKSLRIGASWPKVYDSPINEEYVCQKSQGMHPLPRRFIPECYLQNNAKNSNLKDFVKITKQYFSNIFILARSEVWLCKPISETSQARQFYRVFNEVIGMVSIKNVDYEDGIVALSSISTPAGKSIRFTEISHFYTDTGERLQNEVQYRLGLHEQLNTMLKDKHIDLSYTLTPTSVYKTLINHEGYDVRVGSKTIKRIGGGSSSRCKKNEKLTYHHAAFDTVFKIKVSNEQNLYHIMELIPRGFNSYYMAKSQTVWVCTVTTGEMHFFRIVNKLEVIVSVHEIETFDGIELLESYLDGIGKILEITELKYVTKNSETMLYEGVIDFEDHADFGNAGVVNYYALRKNEEETTQWLGHIHESYHPLKDFVIQSNQHDQCLAISEEKKAMEFTVTQFKRIGKDEDIVDCEFQQRYSRLFPYFEIKGENGNDVKMKGFGDEYRHSSFFKDVSNEVWLCKCPEQNYNFLRTVTKQTLKKPRPTGFDIGKIYFPKQDEVWIETVNDQYEVKMKEIRYLTETNTNRELVDYKGFLTLEETSRSGSWKSGTQEVLTFVGGDPRKRMKTEIKSSTYNSKHERNIGSLVIPGMGRENSAASLVIGSKWSQRFSSTQSTIASCKKISEEPEQPEYRTKIWRKTETGTIEVKFEKFFNFLKIKVWKCTCKDIAGDFIRVVNQFSIKDNMVNIQKIFFYEGVTIFKGEDSGFHDYELVEVKYLHSSSNEVLKFEGRVDLTDEESDELKPISIEGTEVFKKANQFHSLGGKEVYRTVVQQVGMIVEIGQRYDIPSSNHIVCSPLIDNTLSNLKPKFVIVQHSQVPISSQSSNFEDIEKYFHITQEFWFCKDRFTSRAQLAPLEYYRVHSKLRLKEGMQLGIVYHHDGVTVNVEDTVVIEEIKYITKVGNKVVKFDGFVAFIQEENMNLNSNKLGKGKGKSEIIDKGLFRDFNYIFDTEVINSDIIGSTGIVLEVGTELLQTVNGDRSVICEKIMDHVYSNYWAMNIAANTLEKDGSENKWSPINDVQGYFGNIHVEQELWDCKKNEETIFFRVVNRLTPSQQIRAIYHYNSVSVKTVPLPKGSKTQQIIEVKLLDNRKATTFKKYVGELTLMTDIDVVVDRLFQEKKAQHDIARARQLNSLMQYAAILHKKFDSNPQEFELKKIKDVVYSKRKFRTTIVNSGLRVFKIGTHWEEELMSTGGQMKCTLDEWTTHEARYIPRVVEVIDGNLYHLGDEEFHETFKLKKMIEVWLCSNNMDKIIRVVNSYQGKVPIFAVRHTDAVKTEIFQLPDYPAKPMYSVNFDETIYINLRNSKVLKYDGEVHLLTKKEEEKPSSSRTTRGTGSGSFFLRALSCVGHGCQVQE